MADPGGGADISQAAGGEAARCMQELRDAILTPTTVDRKRKTFTGCVYDAGGDIVRAAQRTGDSVSWKPTDSERIDGAMGADQLDAACLYLGHYTAHYGHFLLETLSRFWALDSGLGFERVLFHPFVHPAPRPRFFSPARVSLECFGIDPRRVVIVRKPLRVSQLIVPSSLVEINRGADAAQASIYRRIASCCAERAVGRRRPVAERVRRGGSAIARPSRLYLSRRRLRPYRNFGRRRKSYQPFSNEGEVEALFESLGFGVIYPERLDFAEQVAMYARADVVAGYPGSALHNAVFMRPGTLVIKLGSLRTRSVANPNQRICEELGGVRSQFLHFRGRVVDREQRLGEVNVAYLRARLERLLATA